MDCLVQPTLTMEEGFSVSTTQCSIWPLSSVTSRRSTQWGLDQSQSVTVPLTVTFFPVSYAALPWCAKRGRVKIETLIPRAKTIQNLPFKSHLLFFGYRAYGFRLGPETSFQAGRDFRGSSGRSQARAFSNCVTASR